MLNPITAKEILQARVNAATCTKLTKVLLITSLALAALGLIVITAYILKNPNSGLLFQATQYGADALAAVTLFVILGGFIIYVLSIHYQKKGTIPPEHFLQAVLNEKTGPTLQKDSPLMNSVMAPGSSDISPTTSLLAGHPLITSLTTKELQDLAEYIASLNPSDVSTLNIEEKLPELFPKMVDNLIYLDHEVFKKIYSLFYNSIDKQLSIKFGKKYRGNSLDIKVGAIASEFGAVGDFKKEVLLKNLYNNLAYIKESPHFTLKKEQVWPFLYALWDSLPAQERPSQPTQFTPRRETNQGKSLTPSKRSNSRSNSL